MKIAATMKHISFKLHLIKTSFLFFDYRPILTVDNIDNKPDDQSNKVIDEGKRLLVGSVEQVVCWCRMLSFLNPTKIIYQVFGRLLF